MPPVDATTLRGALLTLAQDDTAWLDAVDRLLGRVLTGTSIHTSIRGLYGWIDGGEAPKLVQDRLADLIVQLPGMSRSGRLDPVIAVHTVLVATAFFETARELLTDDLDVADESEWQQEDHSFVSYLYSDEVPAPSITRFFADNVSTVGRWAADRGERVHRILRRTSPRGGSKLLLEAAFVTRVVARYEMDFRALAVDLPEFATWAEMRPRRRADAAADHWIDNVANDAHATLHSANEAALNSPLPSNPVLPPLGALYIAAGYRLAVASPLARLADESWWSSETQLRHDLNLMLVRHFTSPDAYRLPMLVIGGPGSGKSALTMEFAARRPDTDYIVVRVPLRTTASGASVQNQIKEALRDQTDGRVEWADLVRQGIGKTCLVVLDGLDEMPQVPGSSRSFLDEVVWFQRMEARVGRPVAVLVTTRTSFLDQLLIPDGTPVVALADFDDDQIGRWISAWNQATADTQRRPMTVEAALAHPDLARNRWGCCCSRSRLPIPPHPTRASCREMCSRPPSTRWRHNRPTSRCRAPPRWECSTAAGGRSPPKSSAPISRHSVTRT
ncbi:NACHT domain-containing protein [Lentzea terrae]|uniref:NACHT domain-containing protein n=1 Tax=Lentzea terrae TaxID=2200761 RepID=UPI001E5523FF|nr:ATP-binding protein [Lentzea terrae]